MTTPLHAASAATPEALPSLRPGSVQQGAILLLFGSDDLRLRVASDNLSELFGAPAARLLGREADRLLGVRGTRALERALHGGSLAAAAGPLTLPSGRTVWANPLRVGALVGLEIEPAPDPAAIQAAGLAFAAESATLGRIARRLTGATHEAVAARGAEIAQGFLRLTGYGRAMLCALDADQNAQVLADSGSDDGARRTGLFYPGAEIPTPSRQRFLEERLRMVVDSAGEDVALHVAAGGGAPAALDLSGSVYRGLAPGHRAFLRGMGVRASLSLALVVNNRLWGFVALHDHAGPRICDPARRAMARALADILAAGIARAEDRNREAARLETTRRAAKLVEAAAGAPPGDFAGFLAGREREILAAAACDSLVFRGRRGLWLIGPGPDRATAATLAERVAGRLAAAEGGAFVTNRTIGHWPDRAAELLPAAAGLVGIGELRSGPGLIALRAARRDGPNSGAAMQAPPPRAGAAAGAGPARDTMRLWQDDIIDHARNWPAETEARARILLAALDEAERLILAPPARPDAQAAEAALVDRAGLEAALAAAPRRAVALLRIDLPEASPEADQAFARALAGLSRQGDIPARLGPGRFALACIQGTDDNALGVRAAQMQKAARLCREAGPVAVGIARASGADAPALLHEAGAALHRSRTIAGGRPVRFAPPMAADHAAARRWNAAVERALAAGEVGVLYQPVVDAATLRIREVMAVLSVRDPHGSVPAPAPALPAGIDPPLGRRLDAMLIDDARARARRWRAAGGPAPRIGIALAAARLLDPDFADQLIGLHAEGGLVVSLRDIGAGMPDETLRWAVEALREAGAIVELAGFGAACAPLSALIRLRPDRLCLDPGLIAPLNRLETSLSLVETLAELGAALDIPVAAEGVETLEQAAILRDLGCALMRGPAFAAPVEPIRITQMLLFPPWLG